MHGVCLLFGCQLIAWFSNGPIYPTHLRSCIFSVTQFCGIVTNKHCFVASLDLIINLITAAAPGALQGVAVWRHQNKTHKTLITVIPFFVCLYMQKEVALLLLLIGISALPETSGSRCVADTFAQPPSFALHALLCLWTVSSRFSAVTQQVSLCTHHDCNHSLRDAYKSIALSPTSWHHMCVYSMVQAFCRVADQCSFGNIYLTSKVSSEPDVHIPQGYYLSRGCPRKS